MSSIALASLTEMYTDSEGEEVGTHKEEHYREENRRHHHHHHHQERKPVERAKTPVRPVLRTNLVSYLDDTVISDEEQSAERGHEINSSVVTIPVRPPSPYVPPQPKVILPEFTDVEMPPEPNGSCSNELQHKINVLTEKFKNGKEDMNQIIQERKSFRNPSIYEKLIQFCNINEFGTNYDPSVYDPLKWNESSYYDELAKLQKQDMDQREKERRAKLKRFPVEFVSGTAKKGGKNGNAPPNEEEGKRRKSKWDQVGVCTAPNLVNPSAGLMTLTTAATGTKGTVISAFGSFTKKN